MGGNILLDASRGFEKHDLFNAVYVKESSLSKLLQSGALPSKKNMENSPRLNPLM